MKTDAELVALLLTEARARKAYYDTESEVPVDVAAFRAHVEARVALDAAVQERLEAERGSE